MVDPALDPGRLLELVLEAPAGLCLLAGPEHRFVLVSHEYRRIVAREVVGRTVRDALPELVDQGFVALLDEVYRTGVPFVGMETEIWLDRGTPEPERTIWNFVYQPTRGRDGAVDGIAAYANEVTALVEAREREADARRAAEGSEARFRQLFDAMPQLGWSARPDGYIDFYNRGWYEYTGSTPAQMEGWGWRSVHDPDLVDAVAERWQAAIAAGEPLEMEFPLRRHDGVFRTFLTRVRPIRGEDGEIQRWIGVNTDVEDLRTARALAEAVADQSRAAASMIRELRAELEAARARVAELERLEAP